MQTGCHGRFVLIVHYTWVQTAESLQCGFLLWPQSHKTCHPTSLISIHCVIHKKIVNMHSDDFAFIDVENGSQRGSIFSFFPGGRRFKSHSRQFFFVYQKFI